MCYLKPIAGEYLLVHIGVHTPGDRASSLTVGQRLPTARRHRSATRVTDPVDTPGGIGLQAAIRHSLKCR